VVSRWQKGCGTFFGFYGRTDCLMPPRGSRAADSIAATLPDLSIF
jgi:hypothetical protein